MQISDWINVILCILSFILATISVITVIITLKQNHRSILITKNRYGVANQVIDCGFWGSVGWFNELPDPNQIQNYSDYQYEWKNIPCKNPKNKIKDATPDNGVKKEINYSF